MRTTTLAIAFATCLVVAAPGASAFTFGIELSPGAAIPASKFVTGIPVEGESDQFGRLMILFDTTTKVGLNTGLGFLFNNFEFRYDFHLLPWKRVTATHIMFRDLTDKFYFPIEDVVEPGTQTSFDAGEAGLTGQVHFHSFSAGYRFYLLDGRFRPYVPVAMGFALGKIKGVDPLPGFTFQIGLGAEYAVTGNIAAGAAIRYTWIAVRNPVSMEMSVKDLAKSAKAANASLFDAAVQTIHLFNCQATVSYRF